MDELLTCSCQMKTDLENSADTFSFFKENYPLSSLTNNLNALRLLPDGGCFNKNVSKENDLGEIESKTVECNL